MKQAANEIKGNIKYSYPYLPYSWKEKLFLLDKFDYNLESHSQKD